MKAFSIATHGKSSLFCMLQEKNTKQEFLLLLRGYYCHWLPAHSRRLTRLTETVENKTDEIVNKNPTSYFIKEEVTDAEILSEGK